MKKIINLTFLVINYNDGKCVIQSFKMMKSKCLYRAQSSPTQSRDLAQWSLVQPTHSTFLDKNNPICLYPTTLQIGNTICACIFFKC